MAERVFALEFIGEHFESDRDRQTRHLHTVIITFGEVSYLRMRANEGSSKERSRLSSFERVFFRHALLSEASTSTIRAMPDNVVMQVSHLYTKEEFDEFDATERWDIAFMPIPTNPA